MAGGNGKGRTREDQYQRAFERNYREELRDEHEICPKCGARYVIEGTAGAKDGVCQVCYLKACAEAHKAAAAEIAAQVENDKRRTEKSRMLTRARNRKRLGKEDEQ